jgi:hypothetical protein
MFSFINWWSNLSRLNLFESVEGHMRTGLYYVMKVIKEVQFKKKNIQVKLYKNNSL